MSHKEEQRAKFQPCTVFNNPSSSILKTCTYLPYFATTQCCTVTIWGSLHSALPKELLETFQMQAATSSQTINLKLMIILVEIIHLLLLDIWLQLSFLQDSKTKVKLGHSCAEGIYSVAGCVSSAIATSKQTESFICQMIISSPM